MRSDELKEIKTALSALSADPSLGYLAITSKPEVAVRDRVAWYFHSKHQDLIAAREYYIKSQKNPKRGKRVDLALLMKASVGKPALVELKAMILPDPSSNPEHPLMAFLIDDLNELEDLCHVRRLGVMLMVHIENVEQLGQLGLNDRVVKLMRKFRRWAEDPEALKRTIKNASSFFDRANLDVTALTIKLGLVWGGRIKPACFIFEPKQTRGASS